MEAEVVIRSARNSDAPAIASLLTELGYPNSLSFVAHKIEQLSEDTKERVLVAVTRSNVVGVLSLHVLPLLHDADDLGRVTALVVAEEYRGKGIGGRLMARAEAVARANGCSRMEVTSGDERREGHEFYRRIGYKEVSRRFMKSI